MSVVEDVKHLLEDFGLYQIPVNPIKVADALGVQYVEGKHDGFEGTLVVLGDHAVISVNDSIREEGRRSFTCAHELGHYNYDLAGQKNFQCTRDDTSSGSSKIKLDPKEIRANEFASELLMPKEFFLKQIAGKEPSWDLIKSLAGQFGTSLQAAANKYIKLSHHTCWLVVVKNGKLHRFTKSDFNEFALNLDGTFRAPRNVNGWQTVSANSWLYDQWKTRGKNLLCWPLGENQYGESLVLLWDEKNSLLEDSYQLSEDDNDDEGEFGSIYWGKRR